MATQSVSVIGSGTLVHSRPILTTAQRGTDDDARGERYGTNVIVANPEDLNSVDAFVSSGVIVTVFPVELVGPNINPLPRSRTVVLQNTGSQAVLLSHASGVTDLESFELPVAAVGADRRLTLPFLHNVSIWGRTTTGTSTVKVIIY